MNLVEIIENCALSEMLKSFIFTIRFIFEDEIPNMGLRRKINILNLPVSTTFKTLDRGKLFD
jgi:hypothetical protein